MRGKGPQMLIHRGENREGERKKEKERRNDKDRRRHYVFSVEGRQQQQTENKTKGEKGDRKQEGKESLEETER